MTVIFNKEGKKQGGAERVRRGDTETRGRGDKGMEIPGAIIVTAWWNQPVFIFTVSPPHRVTVSLCFSCLIFPVTRHLSLITSYYKRS
jgi:hypothetical protein